MINFDFDSSINFVALLFVVILLIYCVLFYFWKFTNVHIFLQSSHILAKKIFFHYTQNKLLYSHLAIIIVTTIINLFSFDPEIVKMPKS